MYLFLSLKGWQSSILWSVLCRSFVAPLLSIAVTHCHLLSLVVTCCIPRCHSLSFVVTRCTTRCHSLFYQSRHVCWYVEFFLSKEDNISLQDIGEFTLQCSFTISNDWSMQWKALERSLKSMSAHYHKQLLSWISLSSLEDRAEQCHFTKSRLVKKWW